MSIDHWIMFTVFLLCEILIFIYFFLNQFYTYLSYSNNVWERSLVNKQTRWRGGEVITTLNYVTDNSKKEIRK